MAFQRGKQRKRLRRHPMQRQQLSVEPLEVRALLSVSATINYDFDTLNFFDTTAKRDTLQAAADEIVSRFQDDLEAIAPGGSNSWSAVFFNPATGATQNVSNLNVAADEIIIYAGGRNLGGSLGQGGPGGFSASGSTSFRNTVQFRGEPGASGSSPTDFGPWGGSVTFDTTTTWHFGETTAGLGSGEFDFYSVALHELGHLFGFGTSDSFSTYVSGSSFTGPESVAAYDGSGNVPLHAGAGHWANGTSDGGQETAMDPSIAAGTRKEFTALDYAGLDDVGWEIDLNEPTQTKLVASDLAGSDWFGFSVDIDGNYAVVGAPLQDDGGNAAGAAYIFEFDGLNWVEQTILTAADAAAGDQFGWSVAIDGDTIVVGAHLEDSTSGKNGGSAYVFQRDFGGTDNWGEVTKIIGSGTTRSDKFGFSVEIAGDTIVVGAQHDDPSGSASGAAYVFDRHEGGTNNWGEVAALSASNGTRSDLFGYSVGIDGDVVAVGSRFGNSSTNGTGSAYIFERNEGGTNNWGEVTRLQASDAASSDQFGYSIAVSGNTVAVGARLDDDGGSNTGSVYLYDRDQGGSANWGQVTKVTASDRTAGAWFGESVELDGNELVVGALFAKNSGVKQGGAYQFSRDQGGIDNWGQVAKINADDGTNNDRYGIDVGISGSRIIVGAYLDDPSSTTSAGSAYISLIGSGGSSESLVAEPITAENLPSNRNDYGTVRRDPGGCGCGGHGCAACVPPDEYVDSNTEFFKEVRQREPVAALANSDVESTDAFFAHYSKRFSKQTSRFVMLNQNDPGDDSHWLEDEVHVGLNAN